MHNKINIILNSVNWQKLPKFINEQIIIYKLDFVCIVLNKISQPLIKFIAAF